MRHIQCFCRRIQRHENRTRRKQCDRREAYDRCDRQISRHRNGFAQTLFVIRAETLRNQNHEALHQTHDVAKEEPVEPARRADGGKTLYTYTLTDDQRIHHAVHLLKQIAKQHRHREADQKLRRIADCHIGNFCHKIPLSFFAYTISSLARRKRCVKR